MQALGTLVLVLDVVEIVGDADSQGAVLVENWNLELYTCETFQVYSFLEMTTALSSADSSNLDLQ